MGLRGSAAALKPADALDFVDAIDILLNGVMGSVAASPSMPTDVLSSVSRRRARKMAISLLVHSDIAHLVQLRLDRLGRLSEDAGGQAQFEVVAVLAVAVDTINAVSSAVGAGGMRVVADLLVDAGHDVVEGGAFAGAQQVGNIGLERRLKAGGLHLVVERGFDVADAGAGQEGRIDLIAEVSRERVLGLRRSHVDGLGVGHVGDGEGTGRMWCARGRRGGLVRYDAVGGTVGEPWARGARARARAALVRCAQQYNSTIAQ